MKSSTTSTRTAGFIYALFPLKMDKILKMYAFFRILTKKLISNFLKYGFQSEKCELVPPASVNIQYSFCFKDLDKSKLLSERVFYNWFLG